jgi:uncharacterized protein YbcI
VTPTSGAPEGAGPEDRSQTSMMMQVSNEMVRIYKEQFGRGPTRVRTDFAGPDAILCTLQDTFTPAERNLVKLGEHARLRDVRMFFQYASEEEFRTAVENVTGRKVWSFVSGLDARTDLAIELFYLEPLSPQAT